jgi:hypothetical protein
LRLSAGEREPEYARPYREDGRIGPGSPESVENESYSLSLVKSQAEGKQLTEAGRVELKQLAMKSKSPVKRKKQSK